MTTVLPSVILSVIAVISPLFTAFFTKVSMSAKAKNYVAIGVSVVIAVGYAFFQHTVTDWTSLTNVLAALPVVYGIQQAAYNLLLKDIADKVQLNFGIGSKEAQAAAQAAAILEANAAAAAAAQKATNEPAVPVQVPTVG